ncbi:unnamed protein product [Arctogadus glacialis]
MAVMEKHNLDVLRERKHRIKIVSALQNNRKSIGHPAVSCRVLFLKPSPVALCPQLSLRWLGPRIALLGSTGGVGQDEDETGWDVASWG